MRIRKCWVCDKLVVKIWCGKREDKGRLIYLDGPNGRRWSRRKCPDCAYKVRVKPPLEETGPPIDPLTHRLCRVCSKRLPSSRYFNCTSCAPPVTSYGASEYGFNLLLKDWSF